MGKELTVKDMKKLFDSQAKTVGLATKAMQKRLRALEKPSGKPKLGKGSSVNGEKGHDSGVPHWKSDYINVDCPECVSELGKTRKKLYETSKYVCTTCKNPLGSDENILEQEEFNGPWCVSEEQYEPKA